MKQKRLTPVARKLRRARTNAEERLWQRLRNRQLLGFKFRFQMPIGDHVADFCCEQARLVVELDGGQHADNPGDAARTAAIEAAGYHIIRFWNHDVLATTGGALEEIARALRKASGS
ncbi:MAG TPA: DUF559 domain-containing protein [Allosphingosinicella sp.]|nr:DUF559 domain-containing protein [Allosphingosinicella sp.]